MVRSLPSFTFNRTLLFVIRMLVFLVIAFKLANDVVFSTGDLYLYRDYATGLLGQPMQLPREYPPLSSLIFVVPQILTPNHYLWGYAAIAAVAALLTVLAVDRINGRGWWLMLYLALGTWGIVFFRFDIFVVLPTVLAFAAARRQRWLSAQALLALAVALKLYAVILMPLVVLWEWRTEQRLPVRAALGGAVFLGIAVGSMWLLTPEQLTGLLLYHRERPLEIESLGASLAWLAGPSQINNSYGSINVVSPYSPLLVTLLNSLTVLLLLALYFGVLRGSVAQAPAWALAMLILIVTSKIFSTQYLLWALPFIVLADGGPEHPAAPPIFRWLLVAVCILTSLIYPIGFHVASLGSAQQLPAAFMSLVVLRNLLLLEMIRFIVPHWLASPAPRAVHARLVDERDTVTS